MNDRGLPLNGFERTFVKLGVTTYPVRYTYDTFGNKTSMTTYREETPSGIGDTTTWTYDEASNGIAAHYDYDVVGAVTRTAHNTRVTNRDIIHLNPYRFFSEVHDDTQSSSASHGDVIKLYNTAKTLLESKKK